MTNISNQALVVMAVFLAPVAVRADTIHLCKAYSGGTFWTKGTCSSKTAFIARIANVPAGMSFDRQVDIAASQKRAAEGHTSQNTTTTHTYTTNSALAPGPKAVCDGIIARITQYDSMARQPQSKQMQDLIKGEKKAARDEKFRLRY